MNKATGRKSAGPLIGALLVVSALVFASRVIQPSTSDNDGDWPAYGRDPGGERFSPLDSIDRSNVASLAVAWTFRTGDAYTPSEGRPTAFEATPLYLDDTLYLSTPLGRVFALNPVTGQQRWVFDGKVPRDKGYGDFASRGVSIWQRGGERRLFVATIDARLIALDAKTGQVIHGFGSGGTVDLRKGLRIAPEGFADYEVTSPPAIVGNTVIVGSGVADGTNKVHPSGEVRGFDAITGKLKWTWDPIPQDPSALGADTWARGSAARSGSANAWSVIAADTMRNLVFIPTSSPTHDYYGGERLGNNLFSDSVVALKADTGEPVWHFQTVHHDLWDYDVASPPLLFDWRGDGLTVPAIAVASKTGHLFILNRTSGKPLIPVEERTVPGSDVSGEVAARTQPFPRRRDRSRGRCSKRRMPGEPLTRSSLVPPDDRRTSSGRDLYAAVAQRNAGRAGKHRRCRVGRHDPRPAKWIVDHAGEQSRRRSPFDRARQSRDGAKRRPIERTVRVSPPERHVIRCRAPVPARTEDRSAVHASPVGHVDSRPSGDRRNCVADAVRKISRHRAGSRLG